MKAEELHEKLMDISYLYYKERINKFEEFPEFYNLPEEIENVDIFELDFIKKPTKYNYYASYVTNSDTERNIQSTYWNLLEKSYEENYYFKGCVLKVAIHHYNNEIKKLLNPIFGVTKKDIYKVLLDVEKFDYSHYFKNYESDYHDLKQYKQKFDYEEGFIPYIFLGFSDEYMVSDTPIWVTEHFKKIAYLEECINDTESEEKTLPIITATLNAKEKVLYLNEIGIINFLNNDKNQKMNPTKMSKLLAKVTGENADTLRFSISAILDNNPTKNNPYIDVENVENAKVILSKLGYNLKK